MPELCVNSLSVILIGDFNPSIFQPAWFSAQKLIPQPEADNADNVLIHHDLTQFNLPWLELRVIKQHFSALTTKESHFAILRDLVAGTFRVLSHTPIRQMGLNVQRHYRFESVEKWNEFGHTLVPKNAWLKVMKDPGLLSVAMLEKNQPTGSPRIQINVESSTIIQPNGTYFAVNNHFECGGQIPASALNMVETLEKSFNLYLSSSNSAIEQLLTII